MASTARNDACQTQKIEPTESRPINNTIWARLLTLLAFRVLTHKYLGRFWKQPGGVLFISKFCIKAKPFTGLAEAHTLQFVAQHTSIPVPKVHCAFKHKGRSYIVMSRIDGEMIGYLWALRSEESKSRILAQVKEMVEELRSIKPPNGVGVANVDGGPIYDGRLPRKSTWGPFNTVQDFHKELRDGMDVDVSHKDLAPDLAELVTFHRQPCPSVFSHGDLSSFNIIARGDKVVGIIDWETAGWFPSYWEYVSASNVNPQNQSWQQEVDRFLRPMPYELKVESIRRKYFGDF